jgi:integrase
MESAWRSLKHRQQWHATIASFCGPILDRPVETIDTEAVLSVLTPIWSRVPETASRLRGRIEAVLDYAKARGWRTGENPALWRGHLALVLPRRQKLSRRHLPPYAACPAFMADLRKIDTVAARMLEFAILTAARSGEVRGARWDEIDFEAATWSVPASRMKAAIAHRIPLSSRALEIVTELASIRMSEFVFPGQRAGRHLAARSMGMVLQRVKPGLATPHGFRSSFRNWAGDQTSFPREIAEAALAHTTGSAVEQAYRRSDALEKRRALMEAWASYCGAETDNVIRMARKR